jgi:hypothetical protein
VASAYTLRKVYQSKYKSKMTENTRLCPFMSSLKKRNCGDFATSGVLQPTHQPILVTPYSFSLCFLKHPET